MTTAAEDLLVRIDATTEQLRREMRRGDQQVSQSSGKINRQLKRVDGQFEKLNRTVRFASRALGVFGIALGVRGLSQFTTNTIKTTAALQDQADTAGLGVEQFQELTKAFSDLGGIADTVSAGAFRRFNRRMGLAKEGAAAQQKAFEALGVSLNQGTGPALEQAIRQLASIEDASLRSARASLVFGEDAGPALAATLGKGTAAVEAQIRKIREQGRVIDEKGVAAASRLDDQMSELGDTIRTNLSQGLLSGFNGGLDDLEEIVTSEDFQAGLEAIGAGIGGIASAAAESIAWLGKMRAELREWQEERGMVFDGRVAEDANGNPIYGPGGPRSENDKGASIPDGGTISRRPAPASVDLTEQNEAEAEALREQLERLDAIRDEYDPARRLWREHEAQMEALREIDDIVFDDLSERNQLIEQMEREHQDRLTDLARDGLLNREQFSKMSYERQAKVMLGELSDMTAGVAQHNRGMFELNKVAALGEATIDGIKGAEKTWNAYPYPWNVPMTAAHVASSAARLSAISSTSFGSKAAPSVSGSTPATPVSPVGGDSQAQERPRLQDITIRRSSSRTTWSDEEVSAMLEGISEQLADGAKIGRVRLT